MTKIVRQANPGGVLFDAPRLLGSPRGSFGLMERHVAVVNDVYDGALFGALREYYVGLVQAM